ncbi:hypothetical protein [Dyadobacter pollutisoli]|uniref:Uncharacterized protein n=1 Tax=Dyadobacter pollutisoli TaxID=2910158 RepID=A0A9E8NH03_9BACT|nr:hypothetical protein [Dyadobacter pollutisoli]WAC14811.1 hypothetical protein ON006_12770 [Dyadobacter pollutisoli]
MNIPSTMNGFFGSHFIKSLAAVLLTIGTTMAQDSIKVSYSQEADTLVKQRFIDRYENVFMTKVPTRQMFKVSAVGSEVQGTGFNFAYEYKVLPSLSLEASIYTQLSRFNGGLANELLHFDSRAVNVWANAKARWYYNMNKRINKGLNANNFSGVYIGASYEQSVYMQNFSANKNGTRFGLLYGFQNRIFNHGFTDFSIGLYQRDLGQFYDFEGASAPWAVKNFVLGTQFNIGLAVGDWKKAKTTPLCDVLFCDELIRGHWKVQAPNIVLGFTNQIVRSEVAYERAIGNTPLSAQADVGVNLFHQSFSGGTHFTYFSAGANLALRYYFLQRYQARHGKGGGNFSGPYASLIASYIRGSYNSSSIFQPDGGMDEVVNNLNATAALGYQQRLFKRLYIDLSLFYLKPVKSPSFVIGGSRPYFSSKMTIGFTF